MSLSPPSLSFRAAAISPPAGKTVTGHLFRHEEVIYGAFRRYNFPAIYNIFWHSIIPAIWDTIIRYMSNWTTLCTSHFALFAQSSSQVEHISTIIVWPWQSSHRSRIPPLQPKWEFPECCKDGVSTPLHTLAPSIGFYDIQKESEDSLCDPAL